jgi:hypothetical protein
MAVTAQHATPHTSRLANPDPAVTNECDPETCLERVDCVVCDKPVCPIHYPRQGLYAGEPTTADCMDSATVHPTCHDEHCADPRGCRYEATDYLD